MRIENWREKGEKSHPLCYTTSCIPDFEGIASIHIFPTEIQYFGYRVSMKRGEESLPLPPPCFSLHFRRRFSPGRFPNYPQSIEPNDPWKHLACPFEYSRVSVFSFPTLTSLSLRCYELTFIVGWSNAFGVRVGMSRWKMSIKVQPSKTRSMAKWLLKIPLPFKALVFVIHINTL